MPRLIGKKHNPFPAFVTLFLLGGLVGGAIVGEYAGLTNYIPQFGAASAQEAR